MRLGYSTAAFFALAITVSQFFFFFSFALSDGTCPSSVVFHNASCYPHDPSVGIVNTTNTTECCTACFSNANCGAFTVNFDGHKCVLHPIHATGPVLPGNCKSGDVRKTPSPSPGPAPSSSPTTPAPEGAKNVLFIVVDDLR